MTRDKLPKPLGWRLVQHPLAPWARAYLVLPPDGFSPPVFRGTSEQAVIYLGARRHDAAHEEALLRALRARPWVRCSHIPPARPVHARWSTDDPVARDPACTVEIPAGSDYCADHASLHAESRWATTNPDGVSTTPPEQDRRPA